MYKILITALLAASPALPAAAQQLPNIYGNDSNSVRLYDQNGGYHGNLNGNPYDPNSVSNSFGRYGSPYFPDSINNPYGAWGNHYAGRHR